MKKHNIILDCDPGHDDAVALMLAGNHETINLLGVTVESGNQTLEKTAFNTLNLVQYLNLDVPVCLGVDSPLIRHVEVAEKIHGESGLDGFTFPPLKKQADKRHAVEFIIEALENANDPITLVTTGPLTNIALVYKLRPDLITKIEQHVLMGGSVGSGNVSAAAEFNILCDPEAAHIVFNADVKRVMVGLDVTRQVKVLPAIVDRMETINNHVSDLFVKLMRVYNENQLKVFGLPGGPLHDPVTVAYLIDPSILTLTHASCTIDTSKGPSYGRTNCDLFDYLGEKKNTYVATGIDGTKFWNIIETTLKRYD